MFVTNVVFVETIDQFVVLTWCQGPPHLTHASKCLSLHQVSPHNSQLRIYDRETGQEC